MQPKCKSVRAKYGLDLCKYKIKKKLAVSIGKIF
jgi:hypothetical protein